MDVVGRRVVAGVGAATLLALACSLGSAMPALAQAQAQAQAPGGGFSTADPGLPGAPGSVVARLSDGSVALGETVSLTVVATDVRGELDTTALEQVFDIVGRSRSSQVDLVNGRRRDRASWVLELSPRRIGVFTVPPVTVGGVTSDLQTLEVTEAPSGAERQFFVEAEVDDTAPWVQAQVILTLRVFQGVEFIDASLGEPLAEGLRVQRLGEDLRRRETRDGREYQVTERRYALFPQRSGPMRIDPIALDASIPVDANRVRGFFTPSRRVMQRSEAIDLQVRGRPPGIGGWWFPASEVTLTSQWSGTDATLVVPDGSDAVTQVGVPVTRTLTLRALGATPAMLPTIEPPQVNGASLYDEAPRTVEEAGPAGLLSEQRMAWAVVPTEPGTLELPATSVSWFDTAAGRTRTATLPATRLHVQPGTTNSTPGAVALPSADGGSGAGSVADGGRGGRGGQGGQGEQAGGGPGSGDAQALGVPMAMSPAPAPAPGETSAGAYWRWLALAAVLGWAITAGAWWRERRTTAVRPDDASAPLHSARALSRVRTCERGESSAELGEAVLAWARARWPLDAPASLPALAQRLGGTPAAEALRTLDAALYARASGPARAVDVAVDGTADGEPGPSSLRSSGMPPGMDGLAERLEAASARTKAEGSGARADGRRGIGPGAGDGSLPTL